MSSIGGGGSGGGEANRAFTSLSSETLRHAINSASSVEPGGPTTTKLKKKPLATSSIYQPNIIRSSDAPLQKKSSCTGTTTVVSKSPSSSEQVTIVEHRKRPCGDGFTVHTYLRGKLLGKGGFAKVYKVTSLDTNKEYAVKIVPKANLVKSRARQKVRACCFDMIPIRFITHVELVTNEFQFMLPSFFYTSLQLQTEIKIHRTMKHANICEYKHFFEDKVNCYILLELCHNQSMNEMIKRRKTLTEEETRLLMLQIVDAITFMHDSNVIHRDLKLGNLFLSKNMNIKVGDFGLACRVDSSDEKRRTICGTPNYIAPEVIEGNKEKRGHSFEVDIWSLGVICFTMLVGKPPYESTDVKSTYRRILANEYSFPIGKVSDDARRLIASMLQTNPKMR
jgi:polo-like kinase 1